MIDGLDAFDAERHVIYHATSFAKFANLPIVLIEADPEGCAAWSARVYPQNAYHNTTVYAAYEAVALKSMLELAPASRVDLEVILTWARRSRCRHEQPSASSHRYP